MKYHFELIKRLLKRMNKETKSNLDGLICMLIRTVYLRVIYSTIEKLDF